MRTNKLPQALNEEQMMQMIKSEVNQPSGNSLYYKFLHLRNGMIIYFGFILGLRPGEMLGIKISDIDMVNSKVFISGKNNKLRQGYNLDIPKPLLDKINAYLGYRNVFFGNSEWLFPSKRGIGKIDRSTFAKIVKSNAKRLGLLKLDYVDAKGINHYNIKPYSIRKSFINHVLRETDYNIQKTKAMARHKQFSTTLKYYLELNEEELRSRVSEEVFK